MTHRHPRLFRSQPDSRDASWNARTSSAIANPWLFTGQEWMADLGLSNYKNRFYSPKLGRFLQNDPVRFEAGDMNLYRYANNNPLNRVDPMGLDAAAAGNIMRQGFAIATGEEVVGGGPLDVPMDIVAGATIAVTAVVAVVVYYQATPVADERKIWGQIDEEWEGYQPKPRDRAQFDKNAKNPVKDHDKALKERREKPADPAEAEKRKNDNHDIKKSRGEGGRGDATKDPEKPIEGKKSGPPSEPPPPEPQKN